MQRFALIGAGFIGSVHAANLSSNPDVDFVLVYDVDINRADALARRHGARAATDLDEVFDPAVVDAVFVASSTNTHAEHLRRAIDAGIAVLCEKPIDLDLTHATEVVRHAGPSARAMVNFNRRFDADYAELQRVVTSGGIGDVALIQLTSRGPEMPPLEYIAVSGGQFRDQTVHFFDLALWICGQDPVTIFAAGSPLADPRLAEYNDVDTSVCTLTLPSGALVQIDCSRRTGYGYDERIEVLGSNGLVEARRHRSGAVTRYGLGEVVENGLHASWFDRMKPTYAASLAHFVDALERGEPIAPSLSDGLKAQAIAEAATVSLRTGRSERIDYPAGARP